nr:MAG TPA: winged helix-turn-helix transcription repressor [Caudoviricetes sp.]
MNNNELQLTDLEKQVLEAFCELYCDFVSNKGYPVPRHNIGTRCNLSKYKTLKALKNLREKDLVKLVRYYYEGGLEEEAFMIIGYMPTDKLEKTEFYRTIDEKLEKEIREHFGV